MEMLQVFIKTEEEDEKEDVATQYTHLLTEETTYLEPVKSKRLVSFIPFYEKFGLNHFLPAISSCEEDQLARSCFLFNRTNCYVFKFRTPVAVDFLKIFL